MWIHRIVITALTLAPGVAALDLSRASIVCGPGPEQKAAGLLAEEVARRTGLRWAINPPAPAGPRVLLETASKAGTPEGFQIATSGETIRITGNDRLGTLFGAGYLLRQLRMSRQKVEAPDVISITTAPRQTLRGHQVGFRPKVNTYDGWTPALFEQYVRDLAVFGTNAIELIPPRSDDDEESPHFPLPKLEMMAEMSRIIASYGLQVWIWFPAMDPDYGDAAQVKAALKEWAVVFAKLPRIDAILVPGGDPGHTPPKLLMPFLEKQAESLRRYHPNVTWWISPQGFTTAWMEDFLGLLQNEPRWLHGVTFGPQVRLPLPELRRRVPKRYPIRLYPDITHSVHGEYTVPDWDAAFALSMGREIYNPRPVDQSLIFRYTLPYTVGAITYSEGVNDDVNKMLWSALGWDPEVNIKQVLREYARYFVSPRLEEGIAQGLINLETNWRGPALTNAGIDTTFQQFRAMERSATPQERLNWRFQQMLYRAYFDYYVRARLAEESAREQRVRELLRNAPDSGSLAAMNQADQTLEQPRTAVDLRARLGELAEAQYQSIRSQLSVDRYQALAVSRGASLDTANVPLGNRWWYQARFTEIRAMTGEAARLEAIERLLDRTNPGPGGYYDDLGNPSAQPHLVLEAPYDQDPAYFRNPKNNVLAFGGAAIGRRSADALDPDGPAAFLRSPREWWTFAEAKWNSRIRMRYEGLDRTAAYKMRAVYVSRTPREARVRLVANQTLQIHPWLAKPAGFSQQEFSIPREATANGRLELEWSGEPGVGGPGIGPMIAEVFLIPEK